MAALSVTLQMLAFGGTTEPIFQQGIMESTVIEAGITGNSTSDAFNAVAEMTGCRSGDSSSMAALECLRRLPMEVLLNATIEQHTIYPKEHGQNTDIWLPSVDGDFLPDKPSRLIRTGRFHKMPVIAGWVC
jgi:carboxylesterase type B